MQCTRSHHLPISLGYSLWRVGDHRDMECMSDNWLCAHPNNNNRNDSDVERKILSNVNPTCHLMARSFVGFLDSPKYCIHSQSVRTRYDTYISRHIQKTSTRIFLTQKQMRSRFSFYRPVHTHSVGRSLVWFIGSFMQEITYKTYKNSLYINSFKSLVLGGKKGNAWCC